MFAPLNAGAAFAVRGGHASLLTQRLTRRVAARSGHRCRPAGDRPDLDSSARHRRGRGNGRDAYRPDGVAPCASAPRAAAGTDAPPTRQRASSPTTSLASIRRTSSPPEVQGSSPPARRPSRHPHRPGSTGWTNTVRGAQPARNHLLARATADDGGSSRRVWTDAIASGSRSRHSAHRPWTTTAHDGGLQCPWGVARAMIRQQVPSLSSCARGPRRCRPARPARRDMRRARHPRGRLDGAATRARRGRASSPKRPICSSVRGSRKR